MPVRHDQVEPAIIVHVKESHSPADGHETRPRYAGGRRDVGKALLTLVPEQRVRFFGEVGDDDVQSPIVIEVAEIHAHSGALLALETQCRAGLQCDFFESAIVLIVIEIIWAAIIGDVEVRPAIVVVVRPNPLHAQIMSGIAHARFLGDVLKSAIAAVPQEEIGFTRVASPRTLHRHSTKIAQLAVVFQELVDVYLQISRHEEVDIPITVVITPGRPGAVAAESNARLFGDVLELTVA